jgi:imidazoleglycerol-phosphate dehydratase / histidinol-phosphatase
MKRVIFFDRDGTLIKEPESDFQVDSFEKLEFLPNVIQNLRILREKLDYEFVIITNQDGLGTDSFPEESFWPVHNFMLKVFKNEGIEFDDVLIDDSFEYEKKGTRKPNTGLLNKYLNGNYDLKNSFVIGDRTSDIKLAQNLEAKGILISSNRKNNLKELKDHCILVSDDWNEISKAILLSVKSIEIERITKETFVKINLCPINYGDSRISSGIGFFDHMLEQIARHADIQLQIETKGDLHIDEHHTIEDTAIVLGQAFKKMLSDKTGFNRYGFALPMDDSNAKVLIDFGGRSWFVWKADFKREKIGDMPTEMFMHFFKSFSEEAKCNLQIEAIGQNEHHKIEAIFKAFARSIKMALEYNPKTNQIPSSKGVL